MDRKESRGEWRIAAVTRVENLRLTLVGLSPSNSIASSSKNPVCSTSKINAESEYFWSLCFPLPPSYVCFLRTSPTEPVDPSVRISNFPDYNTRAASGRLPSKHPAPTLACLVCSNTPTSTLAIPKTAHSVHAPLVHLSTCHHQTCILLRYLIYCLSASDDQAVRFMRVRAAGCLVVRVH